MGLWEQTSGMQSNCGTHILTTSCSVLQKRMGDGWKYRSVRGVNTTILPRMMDAMMDGAWSMTMVLIVVCQVRGMIYG
eukprot:12254235-Alexandrium_andersonii.AAC.1